MLTSTCLTLHLNSKRSILSYGLAKGLPTGNERFKSEIEQALSIKLGYGKRGRPRKDIG